MRSPAVAPKALRQLDAVTRTLPAPVGGWNDRDSLASMGKADAVRLRNWFPRTTYCEIRGGITSHVTGMAALPSSLMAWNGPAGNSKMFASTVASIYDTTTAGVVGAAVSTCTLGKWQWLNYAAVSGTTYLIMVNGQDKPKYYDGTTWIDVDGVSVPALTGITTTKLIHVNVHKHRLYFLEKDKMNFWYLPVQQVGGALVEFVLGSLTRRGGYTMAMATWTIDAGEGADDYAVFISSEGEAIVYRGSNPADANNWALVGVYFVGRPIGRNCLTKYGGDLVLITEQGLFPLSQALLSGSIDRSKALTDKINKAFNTAVQNYGTIYGWQATVLPSQNALIVNIPVVEGGEHKQYVMNTISKSWCEFSAWNAESFLVFGGQLYFTTGTSVVKAWNGRADLGQNIIADAKTAFNYFGVYVQKRFTLFRPMLLVNGSLSFNFGINVDFEDIEIIGVASYTIPASALWDVALYDQAVWQGDLAIVKDWRTPASNLGFCAAGLLRVATSSLNVQWASTDFAYQMGDTL